jgi:hypothetical protein
MEVNNKELLKINMTMQIDTVGRKILNFVKKAAAWDAEKFFIGLETCRCHPTPISMIPGALTLRIPA